jgi:hypothetical protein
MTNGPGVGSFRDNEVQEPKNRRKRDNFQL